jgi:type VI secretion system protein ImpK
MSDNPFLEPEDAERTVIRPVPGGRARQPERIDPVTPPAAPAGRAAAPADAPELVATGVNPLVAAAAPLLQLMARLPNTLQHPDPGELRERAVRAMHTFEERARALDLPRELLAPAHYALCASLDDVVLNTPWGSTGVWDANSLVSTFHKEVRSGERFFQLLGQMRQNPGLYLPVLELMYLCLSLGFQGQYRLSPRGPAELDRLREETYAVIVRQRQAPDPELSPHWKGVSAPYRGTRPVLPVWVAACIGAALLAVMFVWLSTTLNAASDDLFARMLRAPPLRMPQIVRAAPVHPPPPAPKPAPETVDELCRLLRPEVEQGLVTVVCTPPNPIVRIRNRGMFASGSATIEPRFVPLLSRIGNALRGQAGKVSVIGYTDNQPIHTVQFPSNFELSAARAQAARAFLSRAVGDPARVTAEGRGEADPLADNATPAGREQNRRIEIVLHRPG